MKYLGDFAEDSVVRGTFNTRQSNNTPITLGGSASIEVYKDDTPVPTAVGLTLTIDFGGNTGLHQFEIDTSASVFYQPGADYSIVISQGTVDGTSVAGTEVGSFSIENRYTPPATVDGPSIRTAVGLSSASLDTQLITIDNVVDAIKLKTDNLPASPAATGDIPTISQIVTGVWSESQSGYNTAGTFGYFVDTNISSAATGGTAAPDIAAAVRTELSTELSRIDVATSTRSTHSENDVVTAMLVVADQFKATVNDGAVAANVNIIEVNGTPVSSVNDFKADLSQTIDANVVSVNSSNVVISDFHADVSNLATKSDVSGISSGGCSGNGSLVLTRSTEDDKPILFTFPTGNLNDSAFTKTKRIDGGASQPVAGTISYLYQEQGSHWYSLSYDATDRPEGEGNVLYSLSTVDDDLSIVFSTLPSESKSGTGANELLVRVNDTAIAIAGAVVVAKTPNGQTAAWGYTDQGGEVRLKLDEGTYTISLRTTAVYESADDQTVVVPAENTCTFNVSRKTMEPAMFPGTCSVGFTVLDGASPVSGALVTATLTGESNTGDNTVILNSVTSATTDANGEATLILVRKNQFKRGGQYLLEVKYNNKVAFKRLVEIPDEESVYAEDLPETR